MTLADAPTQRSMSMLSIAPAGVDELGLVRALADEIWHRHYPGIISGEQIDYMLAEGYSDAALGQFVSAADAGLAIARHPGRAVGFVAWRQRDAGGAMRLEKLYVLPECHGLGIGRALIEHVVAHARQRRCRVVELNVNRANAKAITAYERCGFAIRESGDFPIGNGFVMEDYIMERAL
ncbi:MAG: GNAT family N-acetyltransferase [Rudaea sp.]